jgi:hypothetical protein
MKSFKLIYCNIIYFLILTIGYDVFCIGTFKYSLFDNYKSLLFFIISILILSSLTYVFLIKVLKKKKSSIMLLFFLIMSIIFCISPVAVAQGLIPDMDGNLNNFFYDFFPTLTFINQALFLIFYMYHSNLIKD